MKLERIEAALSKRIPGAATSLNVESEDWGWLDITFQGIYLVIEWDRNAGYDNSLTLYLPPNPSPFSCDDVDIMVDHIVGVLT